MGSNTLTITTFPFSRLSKLARASQGTAATMRARISGPPSRIRRTRPSRVVRAPDRRQQEKRPRQVCAVADGGALVTGVMLNAQEWRLLVPIFLHANILHLALNVQSQVYVYVCHGVCVCVCVCVYVCVCVCVCMCVCV